MTFDQSNTDEDGRDLAQDVLGPAGEVDQETGPTGFGSGDFPGGGGNQSFGGRTSGGGGDYAGTSGLDGTTGGPDEADAGNRATASGTNLFGGRRHAGFGGPETDHAEGTPTPLRPAGDDGGTASGSNRGGTGAGGGTGVFGDLDTSLGAGTTGGTNLGSDTSSTTGDVEATPGGDLGDGTTDMSGGTGSVRGAELGDDTRGSADTGTGSTAGTGDFGGGV